jgi:aryl-alcohol dehydrogenase-like predicted oxidoreductase
MWAWQFAKLQRAADLGGWTRFVAMENQYNLLKREEERELLPMCADLGVGCIPYSPLGKGRLARPWGQQTQRGSVDQVAKSFDLDIDQPVVDAEQAVAEARGIGMAQVAMAWLSLSGRSPDPHEDGTASGARQACLSRRTLERAFGRLSVPWFSV